MNRTSERVAIHGLAPDALPRCARGGALSPTSSRRDGSSLPLWGRVGVRVPHPCPGGKRRTLTPALSQRERARPSHTPLPPPGRCCELLPERFVGAHAGASHQPGRLALGIRTCLPRRRWDGRRAGDQQAGRIRTLELPGPPIPPAINCDGFRRLFPRRPAERLDMGQECGMMDMCGQ
jgi:hypothetical protein